MLWKEVHGNGHLSRSAGGELAQTLWREINIIKTMQSVYGSETPQLDVASRGYKYKKTLDLGVSCSVACNEENVEHYKAVKIN